MLQTRTVQSESELAQILALQQKYLKGKNNAKEENDQGFVTVQHDIGLLKLLHSYEPSVIALDENQVIAYALVMTKACRGVCTELVPMFKTLDALHYNGRPLNAYSFYVMGQVCIDKQYRGLGLFDLLYQKHKELLSDRYDFLITEIATGNLRSMKAHERVGFKTIYVYRDELDEWAVVLWNWQ